MEYIRKELTRKSVTLRLLWLKYRQANPDGYQYSRFCERYRFAGTSTAYLASLSAGQDPYETLYAFPGLE